MGRLVVHEEKLNPEIIKELVNICPFGAMEEKNGKIEVTAACKMCRLCVKKGPKGVMEFVEDKVEQIDKSLWKGVAVYVDHVEGDIHPVTYELIGKARELAGKIKQPVYAVFVGYNIKDKAQELLHYGVDEVFVYDYEELKDFRIEPYTAAMEDFINKVKPGTLLVGATTVGRSLAPRVAARFRTGLTADCTILDMKENTDLVQIRPAFGGNIMAQIVNPNHRPQLATVRYKVMDAPCRSDEISGKINVEYMDKNKFKSGIDVLKVTKKEVEVGISDADVIVAVGRGVKSEKDMDMIKELADLLGAQVAVTRPLVEAGWADAKLQIGLSGRTVKPKLIITCGISGAVQFAAGMNNSDVIVSINNDPKASIFNVAHYGIIGDLYEVIPKLIEDIKNDQGVQCKVM
ncbi:electron transfer flavoprotein subunit alpha [Clostridium tyrobutyricum]|jgi:electron transfer flavoprotein alpha subunit|uniref:Electron transfer flavoprotein, alpha subunit n=2 Tax=Clostridium tyrobutyricum TaxID=1519 RepID=W6N288_CLOTY|nr:electron transfer flavoprotein subunit alpha/FixB family protein [Clostridium tyrobutyricum]AIZ03695.1 electron transfer flavoprotein alpha/beta-subunit [Clostridium tyrobutyricum]AND84831.1 electron transfer flavoprotein alpha subunit [Clostridium tyrobutyricum]ANP69413.1 electron transfer flavoprotein subunit alpha [Clostridium tyrobutyricum]MBR9647713.1 FAD-binding protein [Clostridium tyrobutyricum]MBV4416010.1 FAD-binding protein [Clostridium tyrobutyricum]